MCKSVVIAGVWLWSSNRVVAGRGVEVGEGQWLVEGWKDDDEGQR